MRPAFRAVAFAVAALLATACDSSSTLFSPADASRSVTTQSTLDAEVRALVTAGFPKGHATAILAKWNQAVKAAGSTPKSTLKGKNVPGAGGRSALLNTIRFLQSKQGEATPPAGETREHLVARIVLDMSLYVYGGPSTPVPAFSTGSDMVSQVVSPTSTDTVVTPAQQAAVIFPAGAVSEPTVVIITPDTTYYAANCSGPLVTTRCQYPRFYHFNVFPDVRLAVSAKVQVCHVDAGTNRLPLADHNRFRIAHDRPVSPADYVSGGTVVDSIEMLPSTLMGVTNCDQGAGTSYGPSLASAASRSSGPATLLALSLVHRAGAALRSLVVPNDVYAIDVGVGGFTDIFSNFGVVDPASIADLAQDTGAGYDFAPTMTTVLAGGTVSTTSWRVKNIGSGTSGAFTSTLVIATDSLLTSPVFTQALGGGASLVPGSTFGYPAMTITMPSAAGSYFVGTRVTSAGPDSTATDDWTSTRVTVTAPNINGYFLNTQGTYSTALGGGTSGVAYTIPCPAGSVAIGMSGAAGSYYGWASILNVRLECAQLLANGSLGTTSTTSQAGQVTGGTPFTGICSNGGLLVGGAGQTTGISPALTVAELSGSCANLATVVSLGASQSSIGPWTGSGVNNAGPFTLACQPGYAVTGLQGRSGDILDAVGFQCTPIVGAGPAVIQ